jgi:hypothetical protein
MAEENEHIQKLISARDREVEQRRKVVAALAQKYERGTMENNREIFIRIQNTVETIERAIWHEKFIESKKPGPFVLPIGLGPAGPGAI